MKYRNIDDRWGDPVEVTADDYRELSEIYGERAEVEQREDGIYVNGECVAEAVPIRVEVCCSHEWLEACGMNCDGIAESDIEDALHHFTDTLFFALDGAGFDAVRARGRRGRCDVWHGFKMFSHKLGPVGTFDVLTPAQVEEIWECIYASVEDMRETWVSEEEA